MFVVEIDNEALQTNEPCLVTRGELQKIHGQNSLKHGELPNKLGEISKGN